MNELNRLHLDVRYRDFEASFEGSVEEVFEAFTKFLSTSIPTFDAASKILYSPDLSVLLRSVEGFITITSEGDVKLKDVKLPVTSLICMGLLGSYLAWKFGKLQNGSLSPLEISRIVGKAVKTVRNELPNLIRSGLVERVDKGMYRVTSLGLMTVEREIIPSLRGS